MAHAMKRLSRRVNALGRVKALERENALLRGMLEDAVGLCDAALAHEDARKRLEELVERVGLSEVARATAGEIVP